jgi:hypothetical protein
MEPTWPLPSLDMSCRLCGSVVEVCSVCEKAFTERERVRCWTDGGHTHEACGRFRSGIAAQQK